MKVRSRSGCQNCRTRRIKCDERRPRCMKCSKKGLDCVYVKSYQWFTQEIISPKTKEEEAEFLRKRGPLKRKRHEETTKPTRLHTSSTQKAHKRSMMVEVEFTPQDDPILELNGPGSLTQFKKFKIVKKPKPRKPLKPPFPLSSFVMESINFYLGFYTNSVADTLVPKPYDQNPYKYLLPRMAADSELLKNVLVAFGATALYIFQPESIKPEHLNMLMRKAISGLRSSYRSRDEEVLIGYILVAQIYAHMGDSDRYLHYFKKTLTLIASKQSWDLSTEINIMSYRLIGHFCVISNFTLATNNPLPFPIWPEWSGSYDFLTGMDLNFVKWYNDSAVLVYERSVCSPSDFAALSNIYKRTLRLLTIFNDFFVETFLPDSDISALGILFQEAIKLHLLRRVIKLGTNHFFVQNLVHVMLRRMANWIPMTAPIQREMIFILVTLASECIEPDLRSEILQRIYLALNSGFRAEYGLIDKIQEYWANDKSILENSHDFMLI